MMICSRCGGLASLAGEPLLCERCRAAMPALGAQPRPVATAVEHDRATAPAEPRAIGRLPYRGLGAGLGVAVCIFLSVAGFSLFLRSVTTGSVGDFGVCLVFGTASVLGYALALGTLNERQGATLAHAIVHTVFAALFLVGLVAAFSDDEGGIALAFALLVTGSTLAAGFSYAARAYSR